MAYQSQSSPPEQRRSSKRRDDFQLDDDGEGVVDDRMPRGGEGAQDRTLAPSKRGDPPPLALIPGYCSIFSGV